jgi:hypothetical protein
VGGIDPFVEIAPPWNKLEPALAAHTDFILDCAAKMASLDIVLAEAKEMGPGTYRVTAVAANRGFFPTHTKRAELTQSYLPVRLELQLPKEAKLLHGVRFVASERLEGSIGTIRGEWSLEAPKGTVVSVAVFSQNSGSARKTILLGRETP